MVTREIPESAESLFYRFRDAGIPLLLAGGWAVCFHGYSRVTKDLDWICSRESEASAVELMRSLSFHQTTEGMASRFRRHEDLTFPPVDLIWVNKESFSLMAASPDHTGRNGDIPVISFESLLAMKIYALKDDEHRQGKDLLDIRFLMDFNKGKVSEEQLQALCLKYGGNGSYEIIRNRI